MAAKFFSQSKLSRKDMTKKINFRHRAREHFREAIKLIETNDDSLLISVALRLRMAIECFAYELLQSHYEEVEGRTIETWQPAKLIRELKEIDASIERDRSISIGIEKDPGEGSKTMQSLGTDGRLTADWINKHWNALGSYLHEPTIKQHRDGKIFNAASMRSKLSIISKEIDRVLASKIYATNIKVKVSMKCDCGFTMHRREELIKRDKQIVCASCKTLWGVEEVADERWTLVPIFISFRCPECEGVNEFPAKELNQGQAFTCNECGSDLVLKQDWCMKVKS